MWGTTLCLLCEKGGLMNKKLNIFEKIYCGWIHIIHLFALWKEIVFKTDGSQSEVFFMFIQSDYIEYVELTWWRGQKYNKLGVL